MENKIMPTAEELLQQIVINDNWGYDSFLDFASQQQSVDSQKKLIIEFAKELTKLHVQAALESAAENGNIKITDDYSTDKTLVRSTSVRYKPGGIDGVYPEECTRHTVSLDEDSILNAYPLENIK